MNTSARLFAPGTLGTAGTASNGAGLRVPTAKTGTGDTGGKNICWWIFVPAVPGAKNRVGTPKPAWIKAVPGVPAVPAQKTAPEARTARVTA